MITTESGNFDQPTPTSRRWSPIKVPSGIMGLDAVHQRNERYARYRNAPLNRIIRIGDTLLAATTPEGKVWTIDVDALRVHRDFEGLEDSIIHGALKWASLAQLDSYGTCSPLDVSGLGHLENAEL